MMTSRGGLKELTSVQPLLQASKEDANGAAALTPRPHARVIAPAGLAVLPRELPEQADVVVAEVHDGLLGGGGEGVVGKGGEVALVRQEGRVQQIVSLISGLRFVWSRVWMPRMLTALVV